MLTLLLILPFWMINQIKYGLLFLKIQTDSALQGKPSSKHLLISV